MTLINAMGSLAACLTSGLSLMILVMKLRYH